MKTAKDLMLAHINGSAEQSGIDVVVAAEAIYPNGLTDVIAKRS